MPRETVIEWIDQPEVGKVVRCRTSGPGYDALNVGVYLGVMLDEEDRVPYHYFVKGQMNGHPQSCFGFPAPLDAALTDERTPTAAIREALGITEHEVKHNDLGDPLCPACGHDDVATWADDGESDEADYWKCERFSGGCGATGLVVKDSDPLRFVIEG